MDAAFHQVYSKILSQMDQGCSLMLPSSVQHPRIISTFLEACRALWGSWAQGLCVPHFFDYRKEPSFSLHDLPWSPMGRFKQLLNKEGRGDMRPGRNSQEQPWGKVLVPHQCKHMTIPLTYFADTETPSRLETLMI